jgi:hypothetical protein
VKLAAVITIAVLGTGSVLWERHHKNEPRYIALMILYFIVPAVIVGAMT